MHLECCGCILGAFGVDLGCIWVHCAFWVHFECCRCIVGCILGAFLGGFRVHLGAFRVHYGCIWGAFGVGLGCIWV